METIHLWKPTCGSVSKPCTPVVHIKIAGKWMFIPLKMVLIGIDPYPHVSITVATSTGPPHPPHHPHPAGRPGAAAAAQRVAAAAPAPAAGSAVFG